LSLGPVHRILCNSDCKFQGVKFQNLTLLPCRLIVYYQVAASPSSRIRGF